jgi:hypothetical protein
MAAFLPGHAVERVEAVVRAERDPPLGLLPSPTAQHPRHGWLEVVIADLVQRHAAETLKGVDVAFQERLLP